MLKNHRPTLFKDSADADTASAYDQITKPITKIDKFAIKMFFSDLKTRRIDRIYEIALHRCFRTQIIRSIELCNRNISLDIINIYGNYREEK